MVCLLSAGGFNFRALLIGIIEVLNIFKKITTAFVLTAGLTSFALLDTAHACGADTDCKIGERTYRISMPEGHDRASSVGAIIFNHGYRGTAAGLMRNKSLRRVVSDMGLAFVAPKSSGPDWDIPDAPNPGNYEAELDYFDALKKRLIEQHSVDGSKIMVTGFSAGGMMTWNLACDRGSAFAAFAPIAGTFWGKLSMAKKCPDMARYLIHMHGTSDTVVPIMGRPIGSTVQGEVPVALSLFINANNLGSFTPLESVVGLECQQRKPRSSTQKGILQYCLHPGGHSLRSEWIKRAWDVFEGEGAFRG